MSKKIAKIHRFYVTILTLDWRLTGFSFYTPKCDSPLTNANGTLINLVGIRGYHRFATDTKAHIFVGINSFTSNSSFATFARKYIKRALWDICGLYYKHMETN